MSIKQRAQNEDGRAHLAYYDKETYTSFCWSGNDEEEISVSFDGYGEPVRHTFPAPKLMQHMPITILSQAFEMICDKWLTDNNRRPS